tara:strand:- start:323 stop:988 length:666 start_codon:yes stop_codon:yes gene_type:complete
MNISSDTINILKNFSDINQGIVVKPGNKVQTISTLKNILASAEIGEKFEQEFAIYDLPEFLRAVDMFDKASLNFNGGQNLTIKDANGKQSIKYYFADKSVVVAPTKDITMPDKFVTFQLTKENLGRLMKGVNTLGLPDVAVVGDGTTIKLVAHDKKNPSSNSFDIVVGETDKTFKAYFKTENLKMIMGDYDVAISSQKISHFTNRGQKVEYWIAVEPDSEI